MSAFSSARCRAGRPFGHLVTGQSSTICIIVCCGALQFYYPVRFAGLNGVKQGGVASPVFEPIDNPLVKLSLVTFLVTEPASFCYC